MCGRFSLVVPERFFSRVFVFEDIPEMQPDYNIPPGVDIWAVKSSSKTPDPQMAKLRWGLVPFWAKDPKIGYRMINARSETVAEKPAFRAAFKKRRCLIPADGFYEWKRPTKIPYHIHLKDREPFAMAGLWERWVSPEGDKLDSCTILTTTPNELMEELHDRMPVILSEDRMKKWLDLEAPISDLQDLYQPFPAKEMEAYPVSTFVNSPRNNSPECLERQDLLEQDELF